MVQQLDIHQAVAAAKHLIRFPHSRKAWETLASNTYPMHGSADATCPFDCQDCPLRGGCSILNLPEFVCGRTTHREATKTNKMGEVILLLIQYVAYVESKGVLDET